MEGYNGWANRQTWTVGLWIDNDEGSYRYRRELVAGVLDETNPTYVDGARQIQRSEIRQVADVIEEWVTGDSPLIDSANVYSDLLSHALALVDWYELAVHYVAEYDENGGE